jgi:hypothetical protein
MGRTLATGLRRLMVRTGDSPLRPLWALAFAALRRALAAYLLRGLTGAICRPRGSFATGDVRYGYSDLDLEVVLADAGGANRRAVRRRWARLARLAPPLSRLVDLAVYERGELREARSASALRSLRPLYLGPRPPADEADLRLRPGLYRPGDRVQRREAAWLELQFMWRWVFGACSREPAFDRPYQCVKLVADPARIWLWLAHGVAPSTRREVLERALEHLPEEQPAIARALDLHSALARRPAADLGAALAFCVRTSARIAERMTEESFGAGATTVRLTGADEPRLVLRGGALEGVRGLTGVEPNLLPLTDWRSRAWPHLPDDAFAMTGLDPCDPAAVGAAAEVAGDAGPFAALCHEGLMVLPGPGLVRAVQCEATDPVSFALARRERSARFPDVPGLSASDSARRALLEHRAWLGAWRDGSVAALADWMEAQDRTSAPDLQTLGRLLSAARAALFHASVEAGDPELPLTTAAAAERIGARDAWEQYAACRREHRDPPPATVAVLRESVLALPGYAFDDA